MKTRHAFKTSTAVALVAAVMASLAVALPGLGQTTSSHGGSPSDVYMQTTPDPGNTCLNAGHNGQTAMQQFFDLGAESHVVVYFTFEWALLSLHERGHISMGLDGRPETEVPAEGWRFSGTVSSHTSGTVMWTFDNVAAGHHRVNMFARVASQGDTEDGAADLNACALTVFVIPVAAPPSVL